MFKWTDNNYIKNVIILLFKKNDINCLNYNHVNKLNKKEYKIMI